jgi:hypothetical protein
MTVGGCGVFVGGFTMFVSRSRVLLSLVMLTRGCDDDPPDGDDVRPLDGGARLPDALVIVPFYFPPWTTKRSLMEAFCFRPRI